jgi:hypothetical protein
MSQSQTHPTAASSSNFQLIFNNALKTYEKHTKKDLLAHPLAVHLQACDSPGAILTVLQDQVKESDHSRSQDDRLTRWLDPTVNVLLAFSATLGEGVGLVSLKIPNRLEVYFLILTSPSDICTRKSGLRWDRSPSFGAYPSNCLSPGSLSVYISQAARDVRTRQDTLLEIFEIAVKIMVEDLRSSLFLESRQRR